MQGKNSISLESLVMMTGILYRTVSKVNMIRYRWKSDY
jgi:hypothetical protein